MSSIVKTVRAMAFAIQEILSDKCALEDGVYLDATVIASDILEFVHKDEDMDNALAAALELNKLIPQINDPFLADMVEYMSAVIAGTMYAPSTLLMQNGLSAEGRMLVGQVRRDIRDIVFHCVGSDDPAMVLACRVAWQILAFIEDERDLGIVSQIGNLIGQLTIENEGVDGMPELADMLFKVQMKTIEFEHRVETILTPIAV